MFLLIILMITSLMSYGQFKENSNFQDSINQIELSLYLDHAERDFTMC